MHSNVINQSFMVGLPRSFAVIRQLDAEVEGRLSVIDEHETIVIVNLAGATHCR